MPSLRVLRVLCDLVCSVFSVAGFSAVPPDVLPRLAYNHPGELADLGVGLWAWPVPIDYNQDGLMDLVMSDAEGYLALYERRRMSDGKLTLLPPQRVFWSEGVSKFDSNGKPTNQESGFLQLNDATYGRGGRRTFCIVDWDGDGKLDLMVNSNPNVNFLRGLGKNTTGKWAFRDEGPLSSVVLAGHATKPTVADWNKDGVPELLIGAEDGFFYQVKNPRTKR